MLSSILLTTLLTSLTLAQTDAPIINQEPANSAYLATFQSGKPVSGQIEGVANSNGTGVNFNVNFYAFPANAGPFKYHIHVDPVPANGDCSGTGAHLDPYGRTESPACNAVDPATCQLGDLSGKHGSISNPSGSYQKTYLELYLSTQPGAVAFFGNRSIVVHNAAGERINCGNFTNVGTEAPSATGTAASVPTIAASASSAMSSASVAATSTSAAGSMASSASAAATSATGSGATLANGVSGFGFLGMIAAAMAML